MQQIFHTNSVANEEQCQLVMLTYEHTMFKQRDDFILNLKCNECSLSAQQTIILVYFNVLMCLHNVDIWEFKNRVFALYVEQLQILLKQNKKMNKIQAISYHFRQYRYHVQTSETLELFSSHIFLLLLEMKSNVKYHCAEMKVSSSSWMKSGGHNSQMLASHPCCCGQLWLGKCL